MTLHTLPSPPTSTNSLPFHLSPNGVASKSLVLVVLRMMMLMMVMMTMMMMMMVMMTMILFVMKVKT